MKTAKETMHRFLLKLSILPTIIAIGAISYTYIVQFHEQASPQPQDFYSVVFDAGSTGSRVTVFHFLKPEGKDQDSRVILDKEVFHSVQPGISFYANKPSDAAVSLTSLMNTAIKNVPESYYNDTSINFKATAGLRLLPEDKALAILHEVKYFLKRSPFLISDLDKVTVMSGVEEGLFAWVSVHFLLDLIWDDTIDNSVTTFDLGGGSTQITFEVSKKELFKHFDEEDLYKLTFGQDLHFNIFTKSYLGFGLKSARLGVLGGQEGHNGQITYDPVKTKRSPSGDIQMLTPCLHTQQQYNFTHGDKVYLVKGTNENHDLLAECQKVVHKFVDTAKFVQSEELSRRDINLFSYFFDVARWAKLIPWKDSHEVLQVQDYLMAAQKYCLVENMNHKHPYLCIDLLYVHSLLTVGIGLHPEKLLHVETKIRGKEVSWSVGAALSNEFTYSKLL
uniref:Ectonucleoside triphosphate diphosphohydrolase 5 n=1 Tax=Biomphalaria glabrata TaxID=6526 RepID=A0A2C9LKB0_BIOGL